ncbi:MAG: amidohydrolase [Acidobacteriota bacterium]
MRFRPAHRPAALGRRTGLLRPLLAAAAALAMTGCDTGPPKVEQETADLVIWGGRIVTMDDAIPEVEALAAKDGRIVALGLRADIESRVGDATEVVDLEGRLAIPGFVEAHAHFLSIGDAKIQLDLTVPERWEDVVDLVAEAVADAEPGTWIRGRGWHQDKWTEAPSPSFEGFPLHDALSAVSPDHPVLLTHASGHAAMVNAKAMELAGIDDRTPDPPGGEILRDASGRATGLLNETAQGLIQDARGGEGQAPEAERLRMVELASRECLSKGITSFHDAGSPFTDVDLLRRSADDGTLGIRLWMMVEGPNEELAAKLAEYRLEDNGNQRLAVGGIKRYMDGALGSRGAWLLEPYSDEPTTTGLALSEVDDLRETARLALEHRYQLAVHAIGDRANRQVLDLFSEAFEGHGGNGDLRWRIEHAQHIDPADLPRFAELGIIASVQAVHATSDGPWVPERLGHERSEAGAYPWRALLDSGAVVINGTDAPVEDVDPIANFYSSVTRRVADGTPFYPGQAMSRDEALRSMTLDAAYGAFQEDLLGSLTVGKLADVTVLSKDILTVAEEELPTAEVVYTILGGEIAHRGSGDRGSGG